jgi:16S rRNA (guanine966-N2)-methyltransferase
VRIVAGRWRGRRIAAPSGRLVRPTADRVREAWMSMVQLDLPGADVLDLFAGSGALGLEALSRGAERATFVEQHAASLRALAANVAALGAADAVAVERAEVLRFLERAGDRRWDVAFADPPYRQGLARAVAERWRSEPFARVLGLEHEAGESMPEGGATRRYGDTAVTRYRLPD